MKKNVKSKFAIFVIAVFATSCGIANTNFPGLTSRLNSPSSRYAVINIDSDTLDESGNNHSLWILDNLTKKKNKVFSYGRHVSVFWSPKGNYLTINNKEGSDFSNCILISMDEAFKKMDFAGNISSQFKEQETFKGDHIYIKCNRWTNETSIEISFVEYESGKALIKKLKFMYDVRTKLFTKLE
ncbi:hypothetical protein ACO0LG_07920 [Undibacterium sp. Ji42W]|uniref:hypothetical protein n=1 Tax=Undibacterium sp. Ji42W TaxID=3413039 RepID=UPI003BF33BEE